MRKDKEIKNISNEENKEVEEKYDKEERKESVVKKMLESLFVKEKMVKKRVV